MDRPHWRDPADSDSESSLDAVDSEPYPASVFGPSYVPSRGRGRGRGRGGLRGRGPGASGFRGFGTGRGRGRGGYTQNSRVPEPDPIPDDLGEVLQSVRLQSIPTIGAADWAISGVECVASCNWIGSPNAPIVAIPGALAKWAPPRTPPKLQQDSGTYFRDINAAYAPTYHMHAAALAIMETGKVAPDDVDLVACGGTLRSLFEYACGTRKTFRIAAEAIGETVFLVRRKSNPRETIPEVYGYGHTFPEAYTNWHPSVKGSVSSQRVIKYKFAGMACLVRYEPDGYLPEHAPGAEDDAVESNDDEPDDLADALGKASVSTSVDTSGTPAELQVRRAGFIAPQESTFELKTRASYREDDLFAQFAPSLWLKQTPWFINGFHEYGRFSNIQIVDVRPKIEAWEAENRPNISRFGGLLRWVVNRARQEPDNIIELFRHEDGQMSVRAPGGRYTGALPIDLEDRWVEGSVGENRAR